MKKTVLFKITVALLFLATLSSCKKDETSPSGGNNNTGPVPTTIVGNWEIDGQDLPKQAYKDMYSKWTLTVNADETYSMKYIEKSGKVTDFTGKVVVWESGKNHTNGTKIMYITINVFKINGEDLPGGWKGMYAFEAGNKMRLNIEPAVSSITGPTAEQGFGSGSSGKDAIYIFNKK